MTLKTLLHVLSPPAQPVETVQPGQWETFELITGITLPDDYKDYLRVFGTGMIGGVILPTNPFCARPVWSVRTSCRAWLQEALAIQTAKWQFGTQTFPYAIYPEPDGVLPWGRTDNGDRLFWLAHGSPNDWHILLNEVRSSVFEVFPYSMTEWIRGLLTGDIESTIIAYDALDQTHLFEAL